MYHQFATHFLRLDDTLVGIHHLFEKDGIGTYRNKWMGRVIIRKGLSISSFDSSHLIWELMKIPVKSPRQMKLQFHIAGRVQLHEGLADLGKVLVRQCFICLYIIGPPAGNAKWRSAIALPR